MDSAHTGTDVVSVRTRGGYRIARGGDPSPAVVRADDVESDDTDHAPAQ
jgi:hypothetical protein